MKHPKQYYRDLPLAKAHNFIWIGFDHEENLHMFQKELMHIPYISQAQLDDGWLPVPEKRYALVRCRESEIDDGSLAIMFEKGYTR